MRICMYVHGGSDNHGCEALAVSISLLFEKDAVLFTGNEESDKKYRVDQYCWIEKQGKSIQPYSICHIVSKAINMIIKDKNLFYDLNYKNVLKSSGVFLQIGGDNYCYGNSYKMLDYLNQKIKKKEENISILFGASIEKEMIDKDYDNLAKYDLIVARESITYNNLLKYLPEKKVKICPDPAFILPTAEIEIPEKYKGAIGINVSPMILDYAENAKLVLDNYSHLIGSIIKNTDKNILLVPHVVNKNTDDRKALEILFDKYKKTGRIFLLEDASCTVIKKYISQCSTFIGARTHATIAAYSSCIPTLVVGYSVKSKGIAKDLFGTDKQYVLPVKELKESTELTDAFWWIEENRKRIIEILKEKVPIYRKELLKIKSEIEELYK